MANAKNTNMAKTAEPMKDIKVAKNTKTAEPMKDIKVVKNTKTAEPTKDIKVAKNTKTAEPVKDIKVAKNTKTAAKDSKAAPPVVAKKAAEEAKAITADNMRTWVLTSAQDASKELGRFKARIASAAAKKAASRGHTDFVLRQTGTNKGKHFSGKVEKLTVPKEIKRGDRTIVVTSKPVSKYLGQVKIV